MQIIKDPSQKPDHHPGQYRQRPAPKNGKYTRLPSDKYPKRATGRNSGFRGGTDN